MAAGFAPVPALAAPVSAPANGKAMLLVPLKLTKKQDLDFGTLVTSASAGSATIDPTSGALTPSGGVTPVAGTSGGAALFDFAGTANQQVTFSIGSSLPIQLSDGAGNNISLSSLTLSTTTATVDPTTLMVQVGVGGTINIAANQPDGTYTNTFTVTANYN